MSLRLPIILACTVFVTALHADEQTTEESMAPDSKHRVVFIREDTASSGLEYSLAIEAIDDSGDRLFFVPHTSGWVEWSAAILRFNYKCLWSPDGRFVAIFIRDTKRSGETTIYRVDEHKVEEVKLPDVYSRIRPHLPTRGESRSSWIRPELWLPNHELLLTAEGSRTDVDDGVHPMAAGSFRFVFSLALNATSPRKTAAKIKIFRQDHSIPDSIN